MKKFIAGITAGVVLATSVSAIAATVQNIKASYSVSKLIVNGVDTGKGSSCFISEGTTYVPLRVIAEALNQDISWDSATKTIYINSKDSTTDVIEEPTDLPATNTTTGKTNNTTNKTANSIYDTSSFITEEQAKAAAIEAVGGGTAIYVKEDFYDDDYYYAYSTGDFSGRDNVPHYEIKVQYDNRIYEVEINAKTGSVIDFDID